ncbi:MAG: hypothetical protein KDB29_03380 [Planctomycetes bacterium]|nr:hypothetical protein [Planctomycetota bacterium]
MKRPIVLKQIAMCLLGFIAAIGLWSGVAWLAFTDAWARTLVSEAAASEQAQEMLGLARTRVRENSKAGAAPLVLAGDDSLPGCGFTLDELEGRHYVLANAVIPRDDGLVEILAIPTTSSYPLLRLRFRPDGTGDGVVDEFWPGAG